jgi:hypothetical protein
MSLRTTFCATPRFDRAGRVLELRLRHARTLTHNSKYPLAVCPPPPKI